MDRRLKDKGEEREIRDAFRVFDINGNGFVSAAEIKQAMVRLGESVNDEDVDDMIREADEDGDGHISYDGEYVCNCNAKLQKPPLCHCLF